MPMQSPDQTIYGSDEFLSLSARPNSPARVMLCSSPYWRGARAEVFARLNPSFSTIKFPAFFLARLFRPVSPMKWLIFPSKLLLSPTGRYGLGIAPRVQTPCLQSAAPTLLYLSCDSSRTIARIHFHDAPRAVLHPSTHSLPVRPSASISTVRVCACFDSLPPVFSGSPLAHNPRACFFFDW